MENHKIVHFGGIPTEPDINRIREKYPNDQLIVGMKIPYSSISAIISVEQKTHRFKNVTTSWRKQVEKDTNKIIGTIPGEGFVVLTESEKVSLSGAKLRSAARSARRSYMIASRTDTKQLTPEEKTRLDHQVGVTAKIIASAQLRTKAQLPEMVVNNI